MQLHVHGSFSEGTGSIDSASHRARELGLDVLWWSDHDWRITGQHVLSRFSFESGPLAHDRLVDQLPGGPPSSGPATAALAPVLELCAATGETRLSSERAFDGQHSYQVSAASLAPDFQTYVALLDAPEPGYRRPLAAGLALEFALWIEGAGENGRAWLEAQLSEHPADPAGLVIHRVRYVLGGPESPAGGPWREGPILWVPLPGAAGEWRSYRADLSADAVRGFPEVAGLDNGLTALSLGLAVRDGEAVTAFLDDVRIEAELRGGAMFARQAEVLASVEQRYPGLVQHQGVEISYLEPHLNELSSGTQLFDYGALAEECGLLDGETGRLAESSAVDAAAFGAFVATRAVELAHARGGLVIFDHPFGPSGQGGAQSAAGREREDVLAELEERRLYGADLLEVGYGDGGGHPLRDHLWLWDRLALDGGLYPVGVGTSDHHGGPAGRNDFASWVYARSPGELDLLEGLRAGRVYFGDPARFSGTLELTTDHGQVMGQIVLTDRRALELEIEIDGLSATDRVIVVETGELARFLDVAESGPFRARAALALPEGDAFARVEALARDGTALVYSNPIHFVRQVPEDGLDPARGAFDVGGVRSVDLDGFRLTGATAAAEGGVQISGEGSRGTLVLDCPGFASVAVELKGLQGKVVVEGARVSIRYLRGKGQVLVRDGG